MHASNQVRQPCLWRTLVSIASVSLLVSCNTRSDEASSPKATTSNRSSIQSTQVPSEEQQPKPTQSKPAESASRADKTPSLGNQLAAAPAGSAFVFDESASDAREAVLSIVAQLENSQLDVSAISDAILSGTPEFPSVRRSDFGTRAFTSGSFGPTPYFVHNLAAILGVCQGRDASGKTSRERSRSPFGSR
jgi:hypothetical protein